MTQFLRGVLFLIPAILCTTGIAIVLFKDPVFQKIACYELYVLMGLLIAMGAVILLTVVWQWTIAAILVIFRVDLRMKKGQDAQ